MYIVEELLQRGISASGSGISSTDAHKLAPLDHTPESLYTHAMGDETVVSSRLRNVPAFRHGYRMIVKNKKVSTREQAALSYCCLLRMRSVDVFLLCVCGYECLSLQALQSMFNTVRAALHFNIFCICVCSCFRLA